MISLPHINVAVNEVYYSFSNWGIEHASGITVGVIP